MAAIRVVPLNLTADGLAPTLTAVYYKKGAYNFLKDGCLDWGDREKHSEMAVMEIYEGERRDIEDTAGYL